MQCLCVGHCLHIQWFYWWAPLASNDFHQLKVAIVQLDLGGIVILCVDLTCAQRTTILGLHKKGSVTKETANNMY